MLLIFFNIEFLGFPQMIAEATGRELAEVSDSVAQGVAEEFDNGGDYFKIDHFEAIKKVLAGKEPDFRS